MSILRSDVLIVEYDPNHTVFVKYMDNRFFALLLALNILEKFFVESQVGANVISLSCVHALKGYMA